MNTAVTGTTLTSIVATKLEADSTMKGHYTGGIIGAIEASANKSGNNVYNCSAQTTLKGHVVGGIAGLTYGNIDRVLANSNSTGWKVGGVAGYQLNYAKVKNCLIKGTLTQSNELDSYSIASGSTILASSSPQVAGISAIATMLYSAEDNSNAPEMNSCFINCKLVGSNIYKDSASIKTVTGCKIGVGIKFIDTDMYKNYAKTATTENIVFDATQNPDAKNRPEISDDSFAGIGSFFAELTYDYDITTFNGNFDVFNDFDSSVWNKSNGTLN